MIGVMEDQVVVELDLFTPINQLELKTRKRFTYAEIARETGLSRQTVWKLLNRQEQQRVDVETIAGLITWFRRNGIQASPDTFFRVTTTDGTR